MKKIAKQMSESIELGIVLAASGGFMDAYSYIMRDHVFANAQTGNMLLLGVSISERNWPEVVRYLFPVLAFAAGIMLADLVRFRMDERKRLPHAESSRLTFLFRDESAINFCLPICGCRLTQFQSAAHHPHHPVPLH